MKGATRKRISWPENLQDAGRIQTELAGRVKVCSPKKVPELIAAVDAAFSDDRVFAAACLLTYPALDLIDTVVVIDKVRFPYVPGFLSFREGPAAVEAILLLKTVPGLILVDGQGIAHPRGIGIASHLGVLLDISTVGCAKSRLIGEYEEPGPRRGDSSRLVYRGRTVGLVVRTRDGVRPLFVSPGHRIDIRAAAAVVCSSLRGYRIPEPLRQADMLAKKTKTEFLWPT